jgi:DNA-binding LacI/PurR family transcriptional regulator
MAVVVKEFAAVSTQPGRPLYQAVREAIRDAIDAGAYSPGEQIPSTKDLSEQLSVSLVTAHRALQELVADGVLERAQGKGTFVHPRYFDRKSTRMQTRVGLVLHQQSSIGDFYHGQIFDGVRQAAAEHGVDLMLLRYGEDGGRSACGGYLFVNPLPRELETFAGSSGQKLPLLVVGAKSDVRRVASLDVDNVDLAHHAVEHLRSLGHTRLGYVGGDDTISNSSDRWQGFRDACREHGVSVRASQTIRSTGFRLEDAGRRALAGMLKAPDRPTAIFAGGYDFALDVYAAAALAGLKVPQDLSVVGVDDPPSAAHLSPALTTLRQPLVELGHAALTALFERIAGTTRTIVSKQLRGELVARGSTAAPRR